MGEWGNHCGRPLWASTLRLAAGGKSHVSPIGVRTWEKVFSLLYYVYKYET